MKPPIAGAQPPGAASARPSRGVAGSRPKAARITRHRGVCGGAPCIDSHRITSAAIWRWHREGATVATMLAEYPTLTRAEVLAALRYERQQRARRCARGW